MIFISHRGNCFGPNKNEENSPDYINKALNLGFDVEIDVWFLDGDFYLGHDSAKYLIKENYLENNKLWCHAKNVEALEKMLKNKKIHCFWHQNDNYTITSKNYIWNYPNMQPVDKSIVLNFKKPRLKNIKNMICSGICSDYIEKFYDFFHELKTCTICGKKKKKTLFKVNNTLSDGRVSNCKKCVNEINKEKYKINIENERKRANLKYKNNKEYYRNYNNKWKMKNREKYLYIKLKSENKRRAIKLNTQIEDITFEKWNQRKSVFGNRCAYCNVEESDELKLAQDHIIPLSKGGKHILSNLVPACQGCNSSKNNKKLKDWIK